MFQLSFAKLKLVIGSGIVVTEWLAYQPSNQTIPVRTPIKRP